MVAEVGLQSMGFARFLTSIIQAVRRRPNEHSTARKGAPDVQHPARSA